MTRKSLPSKLPLSPESSPINISSSPVSAPVEPTAQERALLERLAKLRSKALRANEKELLVLSTELGSLLKSLELLVRDRQVRKARTDPNLFMEMAFKDQRTGNPLTQQWFHREWHQGMDRDPRLLIVGPRDHGKTTQIPVGRTIWELGRNPNLRIKIACASDGKAMERLFEIVTHMEENPMVHAIFPDLRPARRGDWTKHKIVVARDRISKDASVEALGILSTATGGRADILIADDVVDRRNGLQYPALRKVIRDAWFSDWTQLLEPEGVIWYICTLWHTDDLSHALLKNEAYRTINHSVGDRNDRYKPIWESKWSADRLKAREKEIGATEYDRGFRNIALTGDIVVVQPDWIQYYTGDPPPLDELIRVTGVDPRGPREAKKGKEDYFAQVCGGFHQASNKIYILGAWKGRPTSKGQGERIKTFWVKYREAFIGIESVGWQDILRQTVLDEHSLPLVEMKPKNESKSLRLHGISSYLESGMVLWPERFNPNHTRYDGERCDAIPQLVGFPTEPYDDFVDAFVYMMRCLLDNVILPGAESPEEEEGDVSVMIISA